MAPPGVVLATGVGLGFLFVLGVAACGGEAESGADPIRSDSAGVAMVHHPFLPDAEVGRLRVSPHPEIVIGGEGAGTEYEFFRIAGAGRLTDGRIVVANGGSTEIRFYDEAGRFLHAVGREGEGPGEFRTMTRFWITGGDSLVVWDLAARRLQLFGPDGELARSTSLAEAPFTGFSTPSPQGFLSGGRVPAFFTSPAVPSGGLPQRAPQLLGIVAIDEARWDSVGVVRGPEQLVEAVNGGIAWTAHTFGSYPFAWARGATLALVDASEFRIELYEPSGRLSTVISASIPEVAVTAEVLDAYVDASLAQWPPGMSDQARVNFRRRIREGPHAPVLPEVRAVFVDADERIWVERSDVPGRGPSRWEVFERDGRWVGRVEMPDGFARGTAAVNAPGFSVAAGRLTGVRVDPETGVETVSVHRIEEG